MRKSIASLASALALLGALAACRTGKPEDQVRKAFETGRAAVEAGDAAGAAALLDPAFRGPEGMDQATARLFLLGTLRQEKVSATVVRSEIIVQGNGALQDVVLILTGREDSLRSLEVSQRSFHLRWRRTGGAWKVLEVQTP